MSAQFIAAKAQKNGTPSAPPAPELIPVSEAEKAHFDKAFGGNSSDDIDASSLEAASALISGDKIPVTEKPKTGKGGVVAAEPDTAPEAPDTEETSPEEETTEEAETTETTEEEAPEAEEEAETEETEETEEEEAPETEENPDKKDEPKAKGKTRIRYNRANFKSDEDFQVAVKAATLTNEFGLTPTQAEAKAREMLNLKPASTAAPVVPVISAENLPESQDLKQAEAAYKAKMTEYTTATQAFREDAPVILAEAMELRDKVTDAKAAVQHALSFERQVAQNTSKALEEYPDSGVEGSDLYVRVSYEMGRLSDAELSDPNRSLIAARRAAKHLNITAKSEVVPVKTAATTPSITPAKKVSKPAKVTPVSGAARTVKQTNAPEVDLKNSLGKILGKDADMVDHLAV